MHINHSSATQRCSYNFQSYINLFPSLCFFFFGETWIQNAIPILISPFNFCLAWMTLCTISVGNREKKPTWNQLWKLSWVDWVIIFPLGYVFHLYKGKKNCCEYNNNKKKKDLKNVCLQANNWFRLLVSYRGINPTYLSISTVLTSTFELSRLHW